APVNYVSLHCVKPILRALSMAISTVSIHIFGDVPSSPLVGILQDHINDWRKTTLCLTSIFFLAAIIWFIVPALQSHWLMMADNSGARQLMCIRIIGAGNRRYASIGWLIRSVHRWSASMMVLMMILHVFRVYLTGGC
ncbi:hypothetical protein HN873_048270, partial [Arachis hypogaea]